MTTLKLDAYIPSKSEYKKYFDQFRAFMSADLSEKAMAQGAFCSSNYKGKGMYPLRSPFSDSDSIAHCENKPHNYLKIAYGHDFGDIGWFLTPMYAGLRVAFKVIYNPDSKLVKDFRTEERTALKHGKKNISSAPIVKFGGKDCIWLNKEDCENGKSKEMELWTLDLVEKAVPFNRNDTEQPLM